MEKEVESFTTVGGLEELTDLLKKENTLSYDKIFNEIEGCFHQVEKWAEKGDLSKELKPFDYHNVLKYQYQSEILIELIEIDVCGSVGGYDKGQKDYLTDNPFERVCDRLYSRYKWLKENYG